MAAAHARNFENYLRPYFLRWSLLSSVGEKKQTNQIKATRMCEDGTV
jgi:hypothetical protein